MAADGASAHCSLTKESKKGGGAQRWKDEGGENDDDNE